MNTFSMGGLGDLSNGRYMRRLNTYRISALVAELVDAPDLGSGAVRRVGSSPT